MLPALPRLLDRIDHVIDAGIVESGRAWGQKAGLSKGFISTARYRLKSGEVKGIRSEEAAALAKAAGVPVEWLVSGTVSESAASATVEAEDRYPSRPAALAMMRASGVKPEIVEAIATMRLKGEDPGVEGWIEKIPEVRAHLRRIAELTAEEPPPSSADPLRPPKLTPPAGRRGRARP